MKTHSTEQAAKQAGITRVTLARWLGRGLIRPSVAVPMKGQTLWRWTAADVRRVRQLRGTFKPGPKPKINVPAIPRATLEKLRTLIKKSPWKAASSPQYKNAKHSYLIFFWAKRPWKFFAHKVRKFGVYRAWRGHKFKYLLLDGECFWVDWPALNRAKQSTLD